MSRVTTGSVMAESSSVAASRRAVSGCTATWSHQVTQTRSGRPSASAAMPMRMASSMPVGCGCRTTIVGVTNSRTHAAMSAAAAGSQSRPHAVDVRRVQVPQPREHGTAVHGHERFGAAGAESGSPPGSRHDQRTGGGGHREVGAASAERASTASGRGAAVTMRLRRIRPRMIVPIDSQPVEGGCALHLGRRDGEEMHRHLEHLGLASKQPREQMLVRTFVRERRGYGACVGGAHRARAGQRVGDVASVQRQVQQAEQMAADVARSSPTSACALYRRRYDSSMSRTDSRRLPHTASSRPA